MRTRIINRGGFRWFNDRNATSIVYPTTKNLCRWWVNFESGFTRTSKIGMIVVRIGDVETPGRTEIDLDIKDKDLAGSSFFFFPLHIFPVAPLSKGWLDVHYFHQFMRCFAEKFRGKDHFDEGDLYSGGTHRLKIGISRIMELLVQPIALVLKCVAINRSKSKRGTLLTSLPFIFLNPICSFVLNYYPFIFSIHRFLC